MPRKSANRPSNAHKCTPERVKELADAGHGRNSIARMLNVNTYQVDQSAEKAGVTFDRERTREAVQALVADAQLEREQLSGQFREVARVILGKVLNGQGMEPEELRDLMWTAGSAAASDARYGRLSIDQRAQQALADDDNRAAEQFAEFLTTIREGFQTIEDIPIEELEDQVDAEDDGYFTVPDDDATEPP